MTDIEGNARPSAVPNPYYSDPSSGHLQLAGHDLFTIMKRLVYVGMSLYGLEHFNAYQVVLHSPHVSHEWFKIGLASTVGGLVGSVCGVYANALLYAAKCARFCCCVLVLTDALLFVVKFSAIGGQGVRGNL